MSVTQEALWAGPELKSEYALFHLMKMRHALQPIDDPHYAAMQAMGTIIDTGWQRAIGPYFDAFLATARSIPEIIECCFGKDTATADLCLWFNALPTDEQDRRKTFHQQYAAKRRAFRDLTLTDTRDTTTHRRGYAPYEIRIPGRYGVTHVGGPTNRVPISDTPPIVTDPSFPPAMARSVPIIPHYTNVTIDGSPLFEACQEYFAQAQKLIAEGRARATKVHAGHTLTPPPDA